MMPLLLLVAAPALAPAPPAPAVAAPAPCVVMNATNLPLARRQSPLDSVTVTVKGGSAKVCYGRPALRGRTMIGSERVPYGRIWRTGANEPTMLHTDVPLTVAGVAVEPGSYSIYTVPGEQAWEVIVNRSITQWGEESGYTDEVKAQEVGRGRATVEALTAPVERFTIRADPARGPATALLLEWERSRVRIPLAAR